MTGPHKRLDGVLAREVDGEFVLLDADTGQVHQLNLTASYIWRACDGQTSAEELARSLAGVFDVEEDVVLPDVLATLSCLEGLKLLSTTVPSAPPALSGTGGQKP